MKRFFCIVLSIIILVICASCEGKYNSLATQTLKDDYEKIVEQKESLTTQNRSEYVDVVYELINQLDAACLSVLQNEKLYYDYYTSLKEASGFAIKAYEYYVVCKFQSGSIGFTLTADYEFSVQKQIAQNIISLLDGAEVYYPIEHSFSQFEQASIYFEQISNLKEQITNCTTKKEADSISVNLDKLITSMQQKAELEISQTCSGMDDTMNEIIMDSFDKMLISLNHYQKQNNKTLELIKCDESFVRNSKLYCKLEMAIFLFNLI